LKAGKTTPMHRYVNEKPLSTALSPALLWHVYCYEKRAMFVQFEVATASLREK
jgi:hypothetical protein